MANPLISVVIPTFNRCAHLGPALKSILAQTYEPLEIVVVNNNCTDGSSNVIEALATQDSRVRHIKEPQQGLNPARNRGLQEARGEIIAYFDDDELAPTWWLNRLWECYEATGADGVGGGYRPLWEAGPDPWLQRSSIFKEMLGVFSWGPQRKPADWLVGGNCSYRRDTLLEVGGFNTATGYTSRRSMSDGADVALGQKLRDAGYKLWYEPEAGVFHKIPRSRQKLTRVLRGAFWTAYADAVNDRRYNFNEKAAAARRRGSDAILLGLCIIPGMLYGRTVKRLHVPLG